MPIRVLHARFDVWGLRAMRPRGMMQHSTGMHTHLLSTAQHNTACTRIHSQQSTAQACTRIHSQHRGDAERADDANGHVACGVLDLLRRSRHRVKANVGEEYDGGAGKHAAEAKGQKWVVVVRLRTSCGRGRLRTWKA